jgi:hypothetical protein
VGVCWWDGAMIPRKQETGHQIIRSASKCERSTILDRIPYKVPHGHSYTDNALLDDTANGRWQMVWAFAVGAEVFSIHMLLARDLDHLLIGKGFTYARSFRA